jgi:DeoR/GlpR family transcriptional regulator of sugar metabolism
MGDKFRRGTRERHDRLLALLRSGATRVEDLASELGISTSTVRRDLRNLTGTGAITRTYGGAVPGSPFRERGLDERMRIARRAKVAIGMEAAKLCAEGSTIFLDAGSTCMQVAENLRGRLGLTILTRGLEVALLLANDPSIEVVILGGQVAPKSHGVVGPLTTLALERQIVDVAFLGVDAVDATHGVGEPTLLEAEVKERIAQRAHQVVVLADASKLRTTAVPAWAPLPKGWTLITNEQDPAILAPFRENGSPVIVAAASHADALNDAAEATSL